MIKIKNIISFLVIILVGIYIYFNHKTIYERIKETIEPPTPVIKEGNSYTKNKDYLFVKHTDTYIPYNYNDLLNIYYSALDQGWDEFTFYCSKEYENCVNDVATISNDEILLSNINNYVHPFNSYSEIKTIYDDTGEVTIKVKHIYNDNDIEKINFKIDDIFNIATSSSMDNNEKLLKLHDYIVNHTIYDINKADYDNSPYDSARMNGLLYEGYGICSAYADIMAAMMYRLGIDNFKISSGNHVWNAIYYNNSWLHIDATWDDPVNASGAQTLSHEYYLITSERLKELDGKENGEHNYENKYYLYF